MNNSRYLIIFVASLYVLFFYMAFWSALPSSITGKTAALPAVTQQCVQLVDCELVTGSAEWVTAPKSQPEATAEQPARGRWISWMGAWNTPLYLCALMSGASYN